MRERERERERERRRRRRREEVWRFAEAAVGRRLNENDVVEVVTPPAEELGIKAYEIDWRIWEASRRGGLRETPSARHWTGFFTDNFIHNCDPTISLASFNCN
jgi:hypothetical protein